MDAFLEARKTLLGMPEEIFQLWFDGRIRSNGWPPESRAWIGALRQRPLDYWRRLRWQQESVNLNINQLTPEAQDIVEGLIDANVHKISNAYSSYLQDSGERMRDITRFIQTHRALPPGLIFFEDDDQLEIVDGSHRLAVFFHLKRIGVSDELLRPDHLAWVGRESDEA